MCFEAFSMLPDTAALTFERNGGQTSIGDWARFTNRSEGISQPEVHLQRGN